MFASRTDGELCITVKVRRVADESSAGGCGYELPIDFAQATGPRLAWGPVDSRARTVHIVAKDGGEPVVGTVRSDEPFGHEFYLAELDATIDVTEVVAYDESDDVVARKSVDDALVDR